MGTQGCGILSAYGESITMTIQEYLENINRRFKTGISSERIFYRGDLQTLLQSLARGFLVTNEPTRMIVGLPIM